jgi:hypothetical protein
MSAIHKSLAKNVTKCLSGNSDKSNTVSMMFYSETLMTLRVLYESGACYDYTGVPASVAQYLAEATKAKAVSDVRQQLKKTYPRKRLSSEVSKIYKIADLIQQHLGNNMMVL